MTWLTAPAQVKQFSLQTGDLPIRQSVGEDPAVVKQMNDKLPGLDVFIHNLSNVKQARPQVTAYPQVKLQPQARLAYTALAGVLAAALSAPAASPVPGRNAGEHSD